MYYRWCSTILEAWSVVDIHTYGRVKHAMTLSSGEQDAREGLGKHPSRGTRARPVLVPPRPALGLSISWRITWFQWYWKSWSSFPPPVSKIVWIWRSVAHHVKRKNTFRTVYWVTLHCPLKGVISVPLLVHASVILLLHIVGSRKKAVYNVRATNFYVAPTAPSHQAQFGRTKEILTMPLAGLSKRESNYLPPPYSKRSINDRRYHTKMDNGVLATSLCGSNCLSLIWLPFRSFSTPLWEYTPTPLGQAPWGYKNSFTME